jgi:hypothetical protein
MYHIYMMISCSVLVSVADWLKVWVPTSINFSVSSKHSPFMSSIIVCLGDLHSPLNPMALSWSFNKCMEPIAFEYLCSDESVRSNACAASKAVDSWLCSNTSSRTDGRAPHLRKRMLAKGKSFNSGMLTGW